jgi:hypothetical protein
MAGYTPNHSSNEIASVVIDFMVTFGVQILAFAGLIALVVLFVWAKQTLK